jgi:hypothetical protein
MEERETLDSAYDEEDRKKDAEGVGIPDAGGMGEP